MTFTLARGGARSDRHTTRHADQVEPPQTVMVGPTQAVRTKLDHELASGLAVGVTVGGDHALVDPPGRLDRDVLVACEQIA